MARITRIGIGIMTTFQTPRPPKVKHTQCVACQACTELAGAFPAILAVGKLYLAS